MTASCSDLRACPDVCAIAERRTRCSWLSPLWRRPPASSDRIVMRFEVFGFAGIHTVTTAIPKSRRSATRYKIVSDLTTRGVTGTLVSLAEHSEVRGRLSVLDLVLPEAFRQRDPPQRRRSPRPRRLSQRRQCRWQRLLAADHAGCAGEIARHRGQSDCVFPGRAALRPRRRLQHRRSGLRWPPALRPSLYRSAVSEKGLTRAGGR